MPQSKRRTIPIIAVCLTLLVCFTVNTQIANADQITDGQDTTSDCKSLPSSISVVDASNDVSKAPVSFSSNTFNLNFPAYCNPVDIYFAVATPDNKLIFVDSKGKLTLDYAPYTAGAKSAVNTSFSVADSVLATEIAGKCVLYWLIAPANGGDILKSIEGVYELGFYMLEIDDSNIQLDKTSAQPGTTVAIELKNFTGNEGYVVIGETIIPFLEWHKDSNIATAIVPNLNAGMYDLYVVVDDIKSNTIQINIETLELPENATADSLFKDIADTSFDIDLEGFSNDDVSENSEILKGIKQIVIDYFNKLSEEEKRLSQYIYITAVCLKKMQLRNLNRHLSDQ